ncbi:MAG: response regulator transcription factor [Dermatophilaceae bacterium]|nr:response regulator transcription factor [Dermatophilaceae bacterium]
MTSDVLRVLVVDDHRTLADALCLAISAEGGMECIGTAHGAREATDLVAAASPDVVVMDVRLDDGDGVEVTRTITNDRPETRVVVLTAHVDESLLTRAADAGACAVLPKGGPLTELMESVRTAPRDGFAVHPLLLRALISSASVSRPTPDLLTAREREVLTLLAEGRDPTTIARALGISVLTCRGYIKSLLVKLDAHSQLEAVMVALRRRLIQLPDED